MLIIPKKHFAEFYGLPLAVAAPMSLITLGWSTSFSRVYSERRSINSDRQAPSRNTTAVYQHSDEYAGANNNGASWI